MVTVINTEEVRRNGKTPVFEGYQHGDVPVSFFLVDAPPGGGPHLHRHPYAEVFVVQEGRASFTVGGETHEVTGGHIDLAGERLAGDAAARVRAGVAHVLEGRRVFADLTVEENLRAGAFTIGAR